MSSDDYYDDDEEEDVAGADDGADGEPSPEPGEGGPPRSHGLRNWLNRKRGWVLIAVLTVVLNVFGFVMIALSNKSQPVAEAEQQSMQDLAIEMLGREVAFNQIYQLIPMRGGKRMTIGLDIVLVLGQLPEERIEGADKPTPEEMEQFIGALQSMEPNIRSRVNSLLQRIPPEDFGNAEIFKTIKEDVKTYANDTLESLNFGKNLRRGIGKRRVTDVLLPMFVRQFL